MSRRLRDEEAKLSAVLKRLRSVEHRARILETGAVAARQRAEAGSRKVRKAFILAGGEGGRFSHAFFFSFSRTSTVTARVGKLWVCNFCYAFFHVFCSTGNRGSALDVGSDGVCSCKETIFCFCFSEKMKQRTGGIEILTAATAVLKIFKNKEFVEYS